MGMNKKERMKNAIAGEAIDHFPSIFIATSVICQILGIKQSKWATDAEILADSFIRFTEICGCEGIYVTRDNLVTHQAIGGKILFPEDDEPIAQEPVLNSLKDFKKLKVPDPNRAAGMKTVITATRKVIEKTSDNFYVMANIDCGPFSTAANLRGLENFLWDIMIEDPLLVHEYLNFCTELVITYGKAMQQTKVHGIQFGDASASLVNSQQFQEFVLPYLHQALNALSNNMCDLWLHICGQTEHIIPFLKDLNIDVFEVDSMVPLAKARQLIGPQIALKGNLDTVFLQNATSGEVYQKTIEIIQEYQNPSGLVVSSGCGVPRNTPLKNIKAVIKACKDTKIN
jgi:uroporphyrinogen decarboxylase